MGLSTTQILVVTGLERSLTSCSVSLSVIEGEYYTL